MRIVFVILVSLQVLLERQADSQTVTCFKDDFEDGFSKLLVNSCNGTENFLVAEYGDSNNTIVAPEGSERYLTNSQDGPVSCLSSGVIRVRNGIRLIMKVLAYEEGEQVTPRCNLFVNSVPDNIWVSSNVIRFSNSTDFADLVTVMTRPANAIIRLECTNVPIESILAIDNMIITSPNQAFCDELFPVITTTQQTTSTTEQITTTEEIYSTTDNSISTTDESTGSTTTETPWTDVTITESITETTQEAASTTRKNLSNRRKY